jgi:hypothetical protein
MKKANKHLKQCWPKKKKAEKFPRYITDQICNDGPMLTKFTNYQNLYCTESRTVNLVKKKKVKTPNAYKAEVEFTLYYK